MSSISSQGVWPAKCPSTPSAPHLSSCATTCLFMSLGCSPSELPHKYIASLPSFPLGKRYSALNSASGSWASRRSATAGSKRVRLSAPASLAFSNSTSA
eukprot:CAMPEP_0173250978 /NCGR_PEP_ID=MMETSP1142-20121109/19885_1 /TAXON_ID=483371 /ORGANISM="non described non described, Strain CCMP2298" /LENGTH=98 /DNA_ID=CAMNT_0014183797 /DNA_START=456 /DNA_END=752 /DNA_ORIENTATION=-